MEQMTPHYRPNIEEDNIGEMDKLLLDSTEQHPLVKNYREKINAAKKELDSGEYEVKLSGKSLNDETYKEIKSQIDKISGEEGNAAQGSVAYAFNSPEEDDTNAKLYKLLVMDKLDSVLARDINVNEKIYNMHKFIQ